MTKPVYDEIAAEMVRQHVQDERRRFRDWCMSVADPHAWEAWCWADAALRTAAAEHAVRVQDERAFLKAIREQRERVAAARLNEESALRAQLREERLRALDEDMESLEEEMQKDEVRPLKIEVGSEWVDLDPRCHGKRIVRVVEVKTYAITVETIRDVHGRAPKGKARRTEISRDRFYDANTTRRSGFKPRGRS